MCGNPVYNQESGKTMATWEQEYSQITRLKYIKNNFSLILTYSTSF